MGDCRCDKPEMAETTLEYGALAITLMHLLFVIKHVFTPSMGVAQFLVPSLTHAHMHHGVRTAQGLEKWLAIVVNHFPAISIDSPVFRKDSQVTAVFQPGHGGVQKWGCAQSSSRKIDGFSVINQPYMGYPPCLEIPYKPAINHHFHHVFCAMMNLWIGPTILNILGVPIH